MPEKEPLEEEISSSYIADPVQRREGYKAILAYGKPMTTTFLLVIVFTFLAILADLLQPYLVKVAIDSDLLNNQNSMHLLLIIGGVYLGLSVMNLVFTYLQSNLLQYAGQNIIAAIRKDLFKHITTLSMSFFDKRAIGSLVTNESSDTETISQFFTQVLLSLVRDGLTLVMIIVFMFKLNVRMAAYSMVLLPIIAIIAILFRRVLRRNYQRARTQLSRLIAYLAENLAGMSITQVFHQEDEQYDAFTKRNQKYLKANLREVGTNMMFNRSFDILGNLSVAFLVWIGGGSVLHGSLEFGVLYAFISYTRQFFQPINQITQQWNTLQSASVSVERLWRIFSTKPDVKDPEPEKAEQVQLDKVNGQVDYNHIRFSYDGEVEILHGLDLHIRPGDMIGIVGATGAGKSSLMSLLTRFYDVNEGSVQIDGTDIRDIPQHTLHRMIGLVQQEPFLYSGSILDNVRLFDESISPEKVVEACRFVGAHPLIKRLQNGYETLLTERGSGLSAGERQLISFARIVVFQPRILILDEATANLDSHTEQLIQSALQAVSEGRTTLVIAHRLSTIMHADRIIVMDQGRIVEEGTHEELRRMNGYYEELYRHSQGQERRKQIS